MASMENVKEFAGDAARSAAKAAKHMAFVSKCRLEILTEQERIRRNYTKLGRIYYKDYITDEEPDEAEYKPLCDSISDSFRAINGLKEQLRLEKEQYRQAQNAAAQPESDEEAAETEEVEAAEEAEAAE